jgi:hypothetical protein
MYASIYAATVHWWPSAAFAVSATILIVPLIAQMFV